MTRPWLIGCAIVCLLAIALLVVVAALLVYRNMAPAAPSLQAQPSSAEIDPADPDQLPPIRVGDWVEALSVDGWQRAQVIAFPSKNHAEVDYEAQTLATEVVDIRLLRGLVQAMVDDSTADAVGTKVRASSSVSPGMGRKIDNADRPMKLSKQRALTIEAESGAQDVPTPNAAAAYLGCFNDTSELELNGFLDRTPTNTPESCIRKCRERGFAFAGLQYGESCLCGDQYGRHGKSERCDYRCTGDPGQTCGGYSTNAIYRTGVRESSYGGQP